MKLQTLTVIFILIMFPIILATSFYVTTEIKVINQQTKYDTMLTNSTFDAVKTFQLNEENNNTSDVTTQKMRNVQASVNTFYKSLAMSMGTEGYNEYELKGYIPCIIYGLYDGYYTSVTKDDETTLLPYNYYTETLVSENNNSNTKNNTMTICYTLDNYIFYYGYDKDGKYYSDSGYLWIGSDTDILNEELKENVVLTIENINSTEENFSKIEVFDCPYIISNCTGQAKKYYLYNNEWYTNYSKTGDVRRYIAKKTDDIYGKEKLIDDSALIDNSAQKYINSSFASNFYDKVGKISDTKYTYLDISNSNNPDEYSSAFNEHRREVIKKSLQSSMKSAIKNYANGNNDFKMPELPETEWDKIINNVSVISFMEGLPLKNKIYMGYSVVTNTKSKEFVNPTEFYAICNDNKYYKITSKNLDSTLGEEGLNRKEITGIYRNIDFDSKKYTNVMEITEQYIPHGRIGDSRN